MKKNVGAFLAFLVKFIKTHAPKVIIVNYYNFSLRRNDLNPELKLMLNHFRRSKLYQKVSIMWLHLMYIHVKRLVDANSLTDITKNYCIRINDLSQFRYFHGSELKTITDQNLICTVYMHKYVKKHFGKQSLEKAIISEGSLMEFPQLIDGYFYSQDSLQSVCEIEWIKKKVSIAESRILEFGAGYGRLAKILFSAGGGCAAVRCCRHTASSLYQPKLLDCNRTE